MIVSNPLKRPYFRIWLDDALEHEFCKISIKNILVFQIFLRPNKNRTPPKFKKRGFCSLQIMIFQGRAVKFQGLAKKTTHVPSHLGNFFEACTFLGMPGNFRTLNETFFGSDFRGQSCASTVLGAPYPQLTHRIFFTWLNFRQITF